MKLAMAIVVVFSLVEPVFADDNTGNADPAVAARVAAAQARLKAKQAAATQGAVSDDPAVLRATIEDQRQQIQALKAEVAMLTREVATMKNNLQPGAGAPGPANDNKVVLTPIQFRALTKGSTLGFTGVSTNAIGYIHVAKLVRIVDESNAIVDIALVNNDGSLVHGNDAGGLWSKTLVIQGVSTKDLTDAGDNNGWTLDTWFKIVGTAKFGGSTYFVAQEIVQADKTHPLPEKPAK